MTDATRIGTAGWSIPKPHATAFDSNGSVSGTADDEAVFVSLETAWLIEGLGHSHANPAQEHEGGASPEGGSGR